MIRSIRRWLFARGLVSAGGSVSLDKVCGRCSFVGVFLYLCGVRRFVCLRCRIWLGAGVLWLLPCWGSGCVS